MNKKDREALYPILADMLYGADTDRSRLMCARHIISEMDISISDLEFEIVWVLEARFRRILMSWLALKIDPDCLLKKYAENHPFDIAGNWIEENRNAIWETFYRWSDTYGHNAEDIVDAFERGIDDILANHRWPSSAQSAAEEEEIDTALLLDPTASLNGEQNSGDQNNG